MFLRYKSNLEPITCTPRLKWLDNPSTSEAVQQAATAPTVQQSVAVATPKQAAVQSPVAVTCTQWMTPATTDVQPPTSRTDVTPH